MSMPCVLVAASSGEMWVECFEKLSQSASPSMLFDSQSSRNFTAVRVLIKINCNFLRDDEVVGFLVCKRKKDFLHCGLKEKKKKSANARKHVFIKNTGKIILSIAI